MRPTGEPEGIAGTAIRKLRTRLKLRLDDLAQTSGVSKGAISEIERGLKSPTVATLEKIAVGTDTELSITFRKRRAV